MEKRVKDRRTEISKKKKKSEEEDAEEEEKRGCIRLKQTTSLRGRMTSRAEERKSVGTRVDMATYFHTNICPSKTTMPAGIYSSPRAVGKCDGSDIRNRRV